MGRNDCGGSIAASAVFIGNVSRAIRTNFDVAMQAAAIEQTVDEHGNAEAQTAVQADGVGSVHNV